MPTFFALLAEKIAASIFHTSRLGELYIPEVGRSVRIIQEPPADEPGFAAWLNDTEHPDGRPFTELVISLVLTETAQAQALDLIEQWIGGGELEGLGAVP